MTRRLLFLINSLEGGGAEKVMLRLAGHFAKSLETAEVRLVGLDDVPAAYPVPPGVTYSTLDCGGSFLKSITRTRRLIRTWQPDVVLSFLTRANCAAVLSRRDMSFRCVISERVNTTSHLGNRLRGRILRGVVAGLYPRADGIVAVSQGVAKDLQNNYRVNASRLSVIGNPIDVQELTQQAETEPSLSVPDDFLVSVGRLVPNKGGDILLRAFAAHQNTTRALVMLGEGPERERLALLAQSLGIKDRVFMPGYVENPHAIVHRATAYVSASRSEGFPNALIEAMAVGCPVAVTDCPSGPAEILAEAKTGGIDTMTEARWGLLAPVDNTTALTAAMDYLDDPARRQDYANRAQERANQYSPHSVFREFTRVLEL